MFRTDFLLPFLALMLAAFLLGTNRLSAQVLDSENKVSIALDDGTQVVLLGRANTVSSGAAYATYSNEFCYLPTYLRLSQRPDKTPEFVFIKFTTDERAEAGGTQGALMHFLMEWGLTPQQTQEAEAKLKAKLQQLAANPGPNNKYKNIKNPKIIGPVDLKPDVPESFRIISGTLTNKQFTPNLVTTGRAPLLPGSKMAVAAILDKNGAQLLAATFEKSRSITDVSLDLRFQYEVLTPAVEGKITVDWSEMERIYQQFKRDYTHKDKDDDTMPWKNSLQDDIITDESKDSLFQYMESKKAVDIKLDVLKANDPVAQEVVKAFMDYFLNSVSDQEFKKGGEGEAFKIDDFKTDKEYQPPIDLYEYHVNKERFAQKIKKGKETFDLKLRIPVVKEMTITENLASWYDGVKHNKNCVSSVNLNDPFFQYRDINLILDIEGEKMFGDEANYVTVNVRKKRQGNPYENAVTIDREFLKNKGLRATMTYARGEDKDVSAYEYKMQWSLKGGRLYPENPDWIKGDWQGVTLAPPVTPRTIQFEGDLEQMKQLGIRRASLEVRYRKFGEEMSTIIPLTVSQGNPLAEKMIYTDRETRGYAYRLILTHEKEGKLALPWESKINDDYVFATIPDQLQDKSSDLFKRAIEMGKTIINPTEGKVEKTNSILDQFKEIFDTLKN